MKTKKFYPRTRFSPEVIKEATSVLARRVEAEGAQAICLGLELHIDGADWTYDSEDEFFADYRRCAGAHYQYGFNGSSLSIQFLLSTTIVEACAPDRSTLVEIFEVFDAHRSDPTSAEASIFSPARPTIFIGHGPSTLWRELEAHLQEEHAYTVRAYEIGARAGDTVRDIVETLLSRDNMAFLVMACEDVKYAPAWRARQDAIYETGLLQGRFGSNRVIAVREAELEDFPSAYELAQIQFTRGNIKEAFGEVVAAVRREFPE